MAKIHNQWLIKDVRGKVKGPYRTSQILEKITTGLISGEESICQYPGSDWFPVTQDPEFYDHLLDALASGTSVRMGGSGTGRSSGPDEDIRIKGKFKRGRAISENPEDDDAPAKTEVSLKASEHSQNTDVSAKSSPGIETVDAKVVVERKRPGKIKDDSVLELANVKGVKKRIHKARSKAARIPLILIASAIALASYVLFLEEPKQTNKIHLIGPQKGRPGIKEAKAKELIAKSISHFERDTFVDYVKAQNYLVQVLEGVSRAPEAVSLLCLTYRELWPHAFRDEADQNTVSRVVQMAALADALGYHSAVCNIVLLSTMNKYDEALQMMDSSLAVYPTGAVLYELKADLIGARSDHGTAIAYLEKTRQLWQTWLKPYVSEAVLREKTGDFSYAAKLLNVVLKANPQHRVAKIYLGILEARNFHHADRGYDLIRAGVGDGRNLAPHILGEAYLVLAEIDQAANRRAEALAWADKSYKTYPANKRVRELMVELGQVRPGKLGISEGELVYLGDQYTKQGNFFAAQAEYKSAFKQNPKNATAALKAGKSLWRLNQSTESIDWIKRAIQADPKYVEAYITLADFYSLRFDFLSAGTILQRANRIQPNSYEVQKGMAQFELRRKSYVGAVSYALKALESYETDVEIHIILVKAYMGQGNYQEAIKYARRGVEIESNNVSAQVAYAKVLAGAQGVEPAIFHIKQLVKSFPQILEYRMALGEVYFEDQRYSDAEKVFRSVLEVEPNHKVTLIYLAKVLRELERPQEALSLLLTAATLDPSDGEPLFEAGQLYIQAKKFHHAVSQFERVLAVNANYPRTHYFIGLASLLAGNHQKALDESMAERKINPNLADSYILAGDAYLAMQQYSNCVGQFQEAIKRRPQGADIYIKVAKCYRLSGSLDYAMRMLDLAKGKESGNPDIYKELGALYEMRGDTDAAIAAYSQYFILAPSASDRSEIEGRMKTLENR
jgi:tetratricopeptide (TPR) repeat protein